MGFFLLKWTLLLRENRKAFPETNSKSTWKIRQFFGGLGSPDSTAGPLE